MNCIQAKSLFSPYLDGAVTGTQMQAISLHLEGCAACNEAYHSLQHTQQLLSKLGARKAPSDLALNLRVAISREAARAKRPPLSHFVLRLENALNAFMVPATAGLCTALLVFGVLMGSLTLPFQTSGDVPLGLHTTPQLEQTAFGATLDSLHEGSLVIEAYVDSQGRVQDYRILSEDSSEAKDLLPKVKNMLIFTTFRPATSMGRPMPGRAVLSFSKISVKG